MNNVGIVGWIVIDDYSDPVRATHFIYSTREIAAKVARERAKTILRCEGYDDMLDHVDSWFEDVYEQAIAGLTAGWSPGPTCLMRISPIYKGDSQ